MARDRDNRDVQIPSTNRIRWDGHIAAYQLFRMARRTSHLVKVVWGYSLYNIRHLARNTPVLGNRQQYVDLSDAANCKNQFAASCLLQKK